MTARHLAILFVSSYCKVPDGRATAFHVMYLNLYIDIYNLTIMDANNRIETNALEPLNPNVLRMFSLKRDKIRYIML